MRKIFLLYCLLLSTFLNQLNAQGDFAPIGAKWHYSYQDESGFKGYYLQEVEKDTVYHGQSCIKLNLVRYRRNSSNSQSVTDTTVMSTQFIYSTPDTVFYYNGEFDRFLPLYIFNVNPGDTLVYHVPYLRSQAPNDTLFRIVVTDVTYSTIDGKSLKTIHNQPLDYWGFDGGEISQSYMEKLGLEEGLIRHAYGTPLGNYFPSHIRCYSDDEIEYINDPNIPCDYLDGTSSLNSLPRTSNDIVIFPNPSYDGVQIEWTSKYKIDGIEIYSITGKRVYSVLLTKNIHRQFIDISKIAKGIYLVKIKSNQGVFYKKLAIN